MYLKGTEISEEKKALASKINPHTALSDAASDRPPNLSLTSSPHCKFMTTKLSALLANPLLCQFVSEPSKNTDGLKGTLDSGSEVHLFTYEAAMELFTSLGISKLKVVGISGQPKGADVSGQFILTLKGPSGKLYRVDLGTAHGMKNCPMNLLSLSLLVKKGAIIHFEKSNCYIVPPGAQEKIPIQENGGLFQVPLLKSVYGDHSYAQFLGSYSESSDDDKNYSFDVQGYSFLSGDLSLWHRRLAHLSKEKLLRIHGHNLVDGFHLVGNKNATCGCDTCTQAKIKHSPAHKHRNFESPARRIGDHVSTDIKSVPYASFEGYKYCINFVDHYSGLALVYFMRKKSEATAKLKQYVAAMKHFGVVVKHIHSDRGSEYFSQEGELIASRDRTISDFDYYCFTQNIRHTVTPIGLKEKIAENWFRDTFLAVDALLWDARLSPAFWCDACAYVSYVHNRTPGSKTGPSTAWSMLTGERSRWDKLRVFGSDAYLHRPNNNLAKIPGMVRGQKLIFVGFTDGMNGYRLFDPENRRYYTHSDVVFYESFNHRIDALRHHDKRRDMIKKGIEQPIILNDFEDESADGVRNLFLHPDASKPASTPLTAELPVVANTPIQNASPAASPPSRAPAPHNSARAQEALRSAANLRPLRLMPVGRPVPATVQDMEFLRHIQRIDAPIAYVLNPKRRGTLSHRRYSRYMHATTVREAFQLGATRDDLIWDFERAFIKFPKHENDLPGHIFNCLEVSELYGLSHALEDVAELVSPTDHADYMIQRAFASQTLERAKYIFNEAIATAFEPELLPTVLRNQQAAARFAEYNFQKVLTSTSSVNIDFSLSPEPLKYDEAIDSGECDDWKKAMDDEMKSMHLFGVFSKVPKSAARGRQILGCKWVYKRKINRFGEVNRHKARLVAQGFAQREYDSFNPEEITSPVAHKNSLRLFLSVCAAENLRIFQADVKNAFLQAPLAEKIYMRAPPGYSSKTKAGEEEIIELRQAVYGLKQSSACFWTAMNSHLAKNGFTSLLGDPCVFRKVLPSGKVILACTC